MFPKSIRCFRVSDQLTSKTNGSQFYLGHAEFPNPIPGGYSTIRVIVVSSNKIPTDKDIPLCPLECNFEKGELRARF